MKIKAGDTDNALLVIRDAAKWLIDSGILLWKMEDLTKEKLLKGVSKENFYTGYLNSTPAAAMLLMWHDPFFWPEIKPNESGFIHKLSVSRKFSGKGYAEEMIKFAEEECKSKNINFLRLDCAGDRAKLCKFYESLGFVLVNRKMIENFDVAFYQKELIF